MDEKEFDKFIEEVKKEIPKKNWIIGKRSSRDDYYTISDTHLPTNVYFIKLRDNRKIFEMINNEWVEADSIKPMFEIQLEIEKKLDEGTIDFDKFKEIQAV